MPPNKDIEHPNDFPLFLRKDPIISSMVNLRKDGNINVSNSNRNSFDFSTNQLKKDFLQVSNPNRRHSRRFSNDSLDSRRNSWDSSRRGSAGSSGGLDDPIFQIYRKVRFYMLYLLD